MPDEEAPYPGEFYAAVHTGNPGDIGFYRQSCAGRAGVLEIACGQGRVGSELSAAGLDVVGLDIDADALVVARAAGLTCIEADMRRFRLERRFERVIIPFNSLYCLLSDDDVVACLSNACRHLERGGEVIFDGYVADANEFSTGRARSRTASQQLGAITIGGRIFDVHEKITVWPATRRVDVRYQHVPRDGGEIVTGTIRQRYLAASELMSLLSQAGLALLSIQGGFVGERFTPDSEHMVVRAGAQT